MVLFKIWVYIIMMVIYIKKKPTQKFIERLSFGKHWPYMKWVLGSQGF